MKIAKIFEKWLKWIIEAGQNVLVPEDLKVQKLLNLPSSVMYNLLPKSPVYSENCFVLFDYQNKAVRLIVKSIKYKDNYSLKRRIAGYLYEEIIEISSDIVLFEGVPPLLVPMPMSKEEKRNRGFNPCEELVREIKNIAAENIQVSYNTLKKVKETKRQSSLSREERMENVKESMAADSPAVRGRVCIVLDDVYTTGASLFEARRALTLAGAKRVIGLFIAH